MTTTTKAREKQAFQKLMKAIDVPDGFVPSFETLDATRLASQLHRFNLTKGDEIKITFDQSGSGHTSFKTEKGWMTFDRLGVEDSFYVINWSTNKFLSVEEINKIIIAQLERVEKSRAYYSKAISIPGIPFTCAPDGIHALQERIKKLGHISFMPSGFGIGYVVSKKQSTYSTRAPKELEAFLAASPLFIKKIDCD